MTDRSVINTPRAIGNYLLEAELGRGGTSQVWRGRHRFLKGREVAVKILLSQDEDSISRFSREAELTSQLRHPNIVAVYDHGTSGTFMYTIMELVPGGSLRQFLEKHKRVPFRDALRIFRQIGAALDFAHEHGIVHRDISPGNVLLDPANQRAMLTDFGIARLPQQSHTTTHIIMGTPGFFSPEHVMSATAVTALSDLYGLGVILYFMLTGALPWVEQPSHPDYKFGPVMPLSIQGLDLPPELDKIFQTLLAKEPQKRYPTAAAAAEAIDRALQKSGVILEPTKAPLAETTTIRAINTAAGYRALGVIESEVEQVLGPDLVREPIEHAHARAQELRDPLKLAALLDDWSLGGKFWEFRRPHLGRIINLRSVSSRNVYFYNVKLLLETRSPPTEITEPDREAADFGAPKREIERWKMDLPKPKDFVDDPGKTEVVPGSEVVLKCERCNGEGHAVCQECKGSRRVMRKIAVTTPGAGDDLKANEQATVMRDKATPGKPQVEEKLIPCPTCGGAGSLPCAPCQGVGRLVRRKVFQWHREAREASAHDDVPNLDEDKLREQEAMTPVYHERASMLKREWNEVKPLALLLAKLQGELGPDTRVTLAEVTVQMIPYTEVAFGQGTNDAPVDLNGGEPADEPQSYTLQIYGFDNHLHVPAAAYDNERRIMVFALILAGVIVVLYTLYIFLVH